MKTTITKTAAALFITLIALLSTHANANSFSVTILPPQLSMTISIPDALQSQIVRQDFENESIFSLKTGDKNPAFLFSVTKVSTDQWETIKDQVKGYSIIENKDGFITFVQKTDLPKIKGSSDTQYQQALQSMDGIISTIRLN